jgi:hypothetical protein
VLASAGSEKVMVTTVPLVGTDTAPFAGSTDATLIGVLSSSIVPTSTVLSIGCENNIFRARNCHRKLHR